jgi:hypothetical protein
MFHAKDAKRFKTDIFYNFFPKIKSFVGKMEKCGRSGQATDKNIIRRMRIACWIANATDTHSENEKLTVYPR